MRSGQTSIPAIAVALAATLFTATGCAPSVRTVQPSRTTEATSVAQTTLGDEPVLGIGVPSDIPSIVATLGAPSSVVLPDLEADPSPWGQWFRWSLPGSLTFRALADDYSDKQPNYRADVLMVELMAGESTPPTSTVYGFALNQTPRDEVIARFGDRLRRSTGGAGYNDALKLSTADGVTYFIFGSTGRLLGVMQSTVDPDAAD